MKKFFILSVMLLALLSMVSIANAEEPSTITSAVALVTHVDSSDQPDSWGTGFFIHEDGTILTSAESVTDPDTGTASTNLEVWTVETSSAGPVRTYSAEVIAYEPDMDLAIVKAGTYIGDDTDPGFITANLAAYYPYFVDPNISPEDYIRIENDELVAYGFSPLYLGSILGEWGVVNGAIYVTDLIPEETDFEDWIVKLYTDMYYDGMDAGAPSSGAPVYWGEDVVGVTTNQWEKRVYEQEMDVNLPYYVEDYDNVVSTDIIYLWAIGLAEDGTLTQSFVDTVFSDYDLGGGTLNLGGLNGGVGDEPPVEGPFTDVGNDHENFTAITTLKTEGVIDGNPDGTFAPNSGINRAELSKMVVEMKYGTPDKEVYKDCFPDVQGDDWYVPFVCYLKDKGHIVGYPDNTFKPADKVNRVEAIKIILNVVFEGEVNIPFMEEFNDVPIPTDAEKNAWYYKFLEYAVGYDLLDFQHVAWGEGTTYTYSVGGDMTRKEVAEMIYRATYM